MSANPGADEALLASYFPLNWCKTQLGKSEVDRHWLYLVAFDERASKWKPELISRLAAMEAVLSTDRLAEAKRADLAGKLRTYDQWQDMMAELFEARVLAQQARSVVYAPRYPGMGPDFGCTLDSRDIQIEVTVLRGTATYRREERFREQLESRLYQRPSGTVLNVACDWMQCDEDETLVYRTIRRWLKGQPSIGEHSLSTPRGELRLYVQTTDRAPSHTFVLGQIRRVYGTETDASQIVAKVKAKTRQLAAGAPAVVVLYPSALLFAWEMAEFLEDNQHEIFELHPRLSAVVFPEASAGQQRRMVRHNPWAALPLTDAEEVALSSWKTNM